MTRPCTPDRTNADGSTTIKMKRACNGCGQQIGDVTDQEMARGINGLPLPDVRRECPDCAPTAPEPVCRPMPIVAGDALCLKLECDHTGGGGSCSVPPDSYCTEVAEETVCGTHSELDNDGHITHAEHWPCKRTRAVTA
ncbi:hypothetical protein [Streptomyces anandii]|uniref:hypothetical protein n=1 Tax=Streptomyces anandii TaxID=285454 RepID=UPI003793BCA7